MHLPAVLLACAPAEESGFPHLAQARLLLLLLPVQLLMVQPVLSLLLLLMLPLPLLPTAAVVAMAAPTA